MNFKQDKYEIHRQAWLKVKKKYGGIRKYSKKIKQPYSTVHDWFNKPDMMVPMDRLVEIELDSGVRLEDLAPFRRKVIRMMRLWQASYVGAK